MEAASHANGFVLFLPAEVAWIDCRTVTGLDILQLKVVKKSKNFP